MYKITEFVCDISFLTSGKHN